MPKGDGFSLLPKLKPLPSVIFVTASDDFAVKAFEVDAVDYLQTGASERLANALQRVVHSQKPSQAERLSYDDRILLDSDDEMQLVFVTEISGITAEGKYTVSSWRTARPRSLDAALLSGTLCCQNHSSFASNDRLLSTFQAVQKVIAQDRDEVSVDVEDLRKR